MITYLPLVIAFSVVAWMVYDLRRLKLRFTGFETERRLRSAIIQYSAGNIEEGNKLVDAVIKDLKNM